MERGYFKGKGSFREIKVEEKRMTVKVGFIGVGGIANAHLAHLAKIKGADVIALCDVKEERLKSSHGKYGGKAYTDYREMLDKEELDCIYICVPPFAHQDIELDIAQRGIPFFIEKPIHLYAEKAEKVEKIIKKKNLITSVGYLLRYMDIVKKAIEVLREKSIALVLGRYFGGVPGAGKGWYSIKEKSGGQIVEQATHIVDLMRYLVGEVNSVYAQGFYGLNRFETYNVEDASIAMLRFGNGVIGSLVSTWLLWSYYPLLEIITKGLKLQLSLSSLKLSFPNKEEKFREEGDPMLVEDRIFIEAVKSGDPSKIESDYSDALRTLKLTLAINESIEKGKMIKL